MKKVNNLNEEILPVDKKNEIIKKFSIGFRDGSDDTNEKEAGNKDMKEQIDKKLREHFKLEFLNRIDEIVIFHALNKEALEKIVDLELAKVQDRLKNKLPGSSLFD